MKPLAEKGAEKKVEYLELIYDLIFVYIIGRSNSMLHAVENGFVGAETFLTYILSTLVILQVWYYTTLFINRYGVNGLQEHLCIFVNMYLLYYMADGTRVYWQDYYVRYNVAWGLILVNLAVQYLLKMRRSSGLAPWETDHMRYNMRLLLIQAAVVFATIPIYLVTHIPLGTAAMVFGILAALLTGRTGRLMTVGFPHLTERVMLYVVFTFGEMIIAVAGYFTGGFTLNSVYFSLMGFLIVVGLFSTYEYFYDHVIDRELTTTGTGYMMIHIFLIVALNNVTTVLEFMREPAVAEIPKHVFLVASIIGYFLFLFLLEKYAKVRARCGKQFMVRLLLLSIMFAGLMVVTYRRPAISIAVSVAYIFGVYGLLRIYGRSTVEGEMKCNPGS